MNTEILNELKEEYKDKWIFHYQKWTRQNSIFIMKKNGEAMIHVSRLPGDDSIFLSDLYVTEDFRGDNLGNELMDICEKIAHKIKVNEIELDAYSNSWVIEWYKKLGFHITSSGGTFVTMIKKINLD